MRSRLVSLLFLSFYCIQGHAENIAGGVANSGSDSEGIVAERGDIKLTLKDIDVVLEKVPADSRAAVVSGPDRLQQIIDSELLAKQIAQRGREMGLMDSPMTQQVIARAAEQEFAKITMDEIVKGAKRPDFALLAKEYYMANSAQFATPLTSVVQHILISKTGRSASEVLARAQEVLKKAQAPGADFQALVNEYSDDESKSDNEGVMTVAASGEFVPSFEAAAHALKSEGDLVQVDTDFGTHVLRLVRRSAPAMKTFETVREDIISTLSKEFEEGVRKKFLSDLRSANPIFHEDMIKAVTKRYGELPMIGNQSVMPAASPAVVEKN